MALYCMKGVTLTQVQVTARKPLYEQKIDRLVVNVANSITAAGGTALEVLERSPGVIVNQQNNSISLVGKEGVVIMINGRITYQPAESIVQMLAGMTADNIETIELITTPPANFDAEGNAGFINIVLKQRPDLGLNGNSTISIGYGQGEVGSAGVNLNYRKGRLNLFSNYNFSLQAQKQEFTNYRKVTTGGEVLENDIITDRDPQQVNHNLRLGADLQLSDRTIFGILLSAYDNKWTMEAENNSVILVDQAVNGRIFIENEEENRWKHFGANLNLEHRLDNDAKLNINADYLLYDANNPTVYAIQNRRPDNSVFSNEDLRSSKLTPIDILVGQIDYSKTINEKLSIMTGVKMGHSEFVNTVGAEDFRNGSWEFIDQFTNESDLTENIAAIFLSGDYVLNEKHSAKVGLRYEYTDSKLNTIKEGEVVNRQFGVFFPSVFYTYIINEDQSTNISYSKRITRPTFNDMAPFAIFLDPNTFFFGNASIQPAISNTVKVDYRYKSYLLSVQYTREDSTIARFQDRVDVDRNQQLYEPTNLSYTDTYSASLSMPIYIGNRYTIQNNIMAFRTETSSLYDQTRVELATNSYNINSTHTLKLNDAHTLEFSGFYNSRAVFGRSIIDPIYGINFGLQKKFDNGSSLRFNIRDILNSIKWTGGTDLPSEGFLTEGTFDFSNRTYSLSYNFNFGNKKLKSSRRRATGSEEERQRVQ
jgi:hypothetical protein